MIDFFTNLQKVFSSSTTPAEYLYNSSIVVMGICVFCLLVAVYIDFAVFHKNTNVKREKKNYIETGSMLAFLVIYYFITVVSFESKEGSITLYEVVHVVAGTLLVILGSVFNILGRFSLGSNWSNQIKIYSNHTFVRQGMYRFVRHPLYASIIWMFLGASLVFVNIYSLLAVLVIFIPSMYYRAKQEEMFLEKEFPSYKEYQQTVGMFFPRLYTRKHETI